MKLLKFLFVYIVLLSCKTKKEETVNLLSPAENLQSVTISKYIFESNASDSISGIKANLSVKNLRIIASDNSIYIFDTATKKIRKKYKLKFDELKLEFLWAELITNKTKSKALVTISTGQSSTALVFQIDLISLKIDWLNEYPIQITSVNYSNDSKMIVLGTDYYQSNKNSSEYYASLFLINGSTGKFMDYFQQGESVAKVLFSDDDTLIYAVLGWPHTDTFVWNLKDKNDKTGAFGKDHTSFYDACDIDRNSFVTIGSDGIYKWTKSNPKDFEIVYKKYINAHDKIFKAENEYILIDYPNGFANPPTIRYFDSSFREIASVKLQTTFDDVTLSDHKLEGITDREKIICYDLKSKSISEMADIK